MNGTSYVSEVYFSIDEGSEFTNELGLRVTFPLPVELYQVLLSLTTWNSKSINCLLVLAWRFWRSHNLTFVGYHDGSKHFKQQHYASRLREGGQSCPWAKPSHQALCAWFGMLRQCSSSWQWLDFRLGVSNKANCINFTRSFTYSLKGRFMRLAARSLLPVES